METEKVDLSGAPLSWKIFKTISNIPQFFGYDSAHRKKHGLLSPHFWYREAWHTTGGLLLATLAFFISLLLVWWTRSFVAANFVFYGTWGGLCLAIIGMEARQIKGGQTFIKGVFDWIFWMFGYSIVLWKPLTTHWMYYVSFAALIGFFRLRYGDRRSENIKTMWK